MKARFFWIVPAAIACAAGLATPASAEWVEVRSTNFRFFSEDKPEEVVARVTRLETLDKIVRSVTGSKKAPGPLPVTAFELQTMDDVQATLPGSPRGVAAYYSTSDYGAHLITFHRPLRVSSGASRVKRTYRIQDEVTQHEYLHHMMFQYFPTNYPTFYPEGFAEYYGTIQFEADDVIVVGHAPTGRLEAMSNWLPVREMLTAKSYADIQNLGGLYAQGWLLTHMAAARPERGKQLQQYLSDVSKGVAYEDAAIRAFGDLDAFDRELRAYKDQVTALTIKLNGIDPGPVEVRKLSAVEEALVETEMKLRLTIKKSELGSLANHAETVAASHPGDAYSLGTLALLRWLDGDSARAAAAADRALAIDPRLGRGNMVKGLVLAQAARGEAGLDDAVMERARQHFLAAIQADKTDSRSRIAYFESYADAGLLPPVEAQNALMEAFQLIPSNNDLRYKLARDFEARGMIEDAIFLIKPAAYGTFDGDEREKRKRQRQLDEAAEKYTNISNTETPLEMLRRLEAKQAGTWDEASGTIRQAKS